MLGFNEKRGKKIIPGRETEKKSDTERGGGGGDLGKF